MESIKLTKTQKLILLALAIIPILAILIFNSDQSFDEPFFIRNCELFSRYGLSHNFLVNMRLQAPGPTYQIFHFFTSSFTGYNVVWMRVVTIVTTLICVYIFKKILEAQNNLRRGHFLDIAILFFLIPTTWVFGTMAITQIPAMLCSLAYILLFNRKVSVFNSILLGILLGLSVLGRVHYAAFVLFCLFDVFKNFNKKIFIKNLVICMVASLICLPIFITWNGYVPPDQQGAFSNTSQLHFSSVFTGAIILFFFTTILLRPNWILNRKNLLFVVIFIISLLANYLFELFPYHSKSISFLLSFLPEKFVSTLPIPLFFTITLFMMYHYVDFKEIAKLNTRGVMGIIIIATILSGLRSTQFSDGYVFQVLPLIIIFNFENIDSKIIVPKYLFFSCVGFIYLLHRMMII